MSLSDIDYSYKIDCNLNYLSPKKMIAAFEEAKLISYQSIFRFLEELGNPSPRIKKFKKVRNNIVFVLNYVDSEFNHPLKEIVFKAILAKFNRCYLTVRKALIFMDETRKYLDNYSVLNIISYSTRRCRSSCMVENLYDCIILDWAEEE